MRLAIRPGPSYLENSPPKIDAAQFNKVHTIYSPADVINEHLQIFLKLKTMEIDRYLDCHCNLKYYKLKKQKKLCWIWFGIATVILQHPRATVMIGSLSAAAQAGTHIQELL